MGTLGPFPGFVLATVDLQRGKQLQDDKAFSTRNIKSGGTRSLGNSLVGSGQSPGQVRGQLLCGFSGKDSEARSQLCLS